MKRLNAGELIELLSKFDPELILSFDDFYCICGCRIAEREDGTKYLNIY